MLNVWVAESIFRRHCSQYSNLCVIMDMCHFFYIKNNPVIAHCGENVSNWWYRFGNKSSCRRKLGFGNEFDTWPYLADTARPHHRVIYPTITLAAIMPIHCMHFFSLLFKLSFNSLQPSDAYMRQIIIWTNDRILLIGPLGTNFSDILIEIHKFPFKKMHLKISSAKWRQFCLGLNVLIAHWKNVSILPSPHHLSLFLS